ncbi:MAG: deoxynucleoside kinase [Candidatus Sericytochromatia bacterium]|nr:deoxynucleoside kinase [Candidatus Sericytochromatia bacterium]
MQYIAIEGVIGVGKTSLAKTMASCLPSSELMLEIVEENPFLQNFYADRAGNAFQTQIFFLLSRFRQQQRLETALQQKAVVISDYLFAKDLIFAQQNLDTDELAMHQQLFGLMDEKVPQPGLVIYLRAAVETLMGRIAQRDRSFERQMDQTYIESLSNAYESFFSTFQKTYPGVPVLTIDTDSLNLVSNPRDIAQVRNLILANEVVA